MSSLRRPGVLAALLAAVAALVGGLCLFFGEAVSSWAAARYAGALQAAGQGKFSDPAAFVRGRLWEAVGLIALALLIAALDLALWARFSSWARRRVAAWIVGVAVVFVQVNGVTWAASQTALFWLVMWQGEDSSDPYTPFALKQILAEEEGVRHHVVLLGNSQVSSQVEEDQIARRLGDHVRVTELGYMGAEPFDLLLIQPTYAALHPDAAVVYLSELSFYRGVVGMRYPPFMTAQGQGDFVSLGGERLEDPGLGAARWYARVARALPVYAVRAPIVRRVFGSRVVGMDQARYNVDLIEDLDARAEATADVFVRPDAPSAEFQKRALEAFVQRSAEAGTDVVLLAGALNPRLGDRLDPALRADFLASLQVLDARYPTVHVVGPGDMPAPSAHAFRDLTHVTEAEKQRGTRAMLPALLPPLQDAIRRRSEGEPRSEALGTFRPTH